MRETRLNRIDELVTELLNNAERNYCKFVTGEVDFFPETNTSRKTWHLWKLLLRHKLSMKITSPNFFLCLMISTFLNFKEFPSKRSNRTFPVADYHVENSNNRLFHTGPNICNLLNRNTKYLPKN